jgi:hypothetical protein
MTENFLVPGEISFTLADSWCRRSAGGEPGAGGLLCAGAAGDAGGSGSSVAGGVVGDGPEGRVGCNGITFVDRLPGLELCHYDASA